MNKLLVHPSLPHSSHAARLFRRRCKQSIVPQMVRRQRTSALGFSSLIAHQARALNPAHFSPGQWDGYLKQGKVTATNYKQCLAVEVPAFIAFYRSRADFAGVDVLTLEVKSQGGKTKLQRISVTVGTGSPGRGS